MKPRLRVAASGMCCPVGLTAKAARAAIRAGLDRFTASEFVDERGDPITVSRVELGDLWGPRRLAVMVAAVVEECTRAVDDHVPRATALLLLLSEAGRPGFNPRWATACAEAAVPFASERSGTIALGRTGLGEAVRHAHAILLEGIAQRVMVVGVDSYLNARAVTWLLGRDRVLGTARRDGFVPGEGAGALLLELEQPGAGGLHILGVGDGEETARIDNDEATRAEGLTRALRAAFADAGRTMRDMDFRATDATGEQLFFREAALAATRLMERREGEFPQIHITDSVGETGAAAGPLTLAYLADAMARGYAPGRRAVMHLAGDGPRREALVLEHLTP